VKAHRTRDGGVGRHGLGSFGRQNRLHEGVVAGMAQDKKISSACGEAAELSALVRMMVVAIVVVNVAGFVLVHIVASQLTGTK